MGYEVYKCPQCAHYNLKPQPESLHVHAECPECKKDIDFSLNGSKTVPFGRGPRTSLKIYSFDKKNDAYWFYLNMNADKDKRQKIKGKMRRQVYNDA